MGGERHEVTLEETREKFPEHSIVLDEREPIITADEQRRRAHQKHGCESGTSDIAATSLRNQAIEVRAAAISAAGARLDHD
jgi:hypothetical protein